MFTWNDGSFYIGNFKDNNINGKGNYIGKDKKKYEGDWEDNKMNGKGVETWDDGK